MSKEKKIRQWIQSHYTEQDERDLQELHQKLGLSYTPPKKRKKFSIKKLVTICSCATSAALILFFTLFFTLRQNDSIKPENKSRYCTADQYTYENTSLTLKDYAIQTDQKILHLNIYENVIPETVQNSIFILKDSQEKIAFREYMMVFIQPSSVYTITYYVTDDYTELEELEKYKNSCIYTNQINQTNIYHVYNNSTASMRWEYNGYRYYLTIEGVESSDVAFGFIEGLFDQ